jgi:5-methylcytosine-specific restriction endonuclease McrBC regulatory subunit McrC
MRGRNDRFYCRYLHFTDDILENQILKAALKKAKRFIAEYFGDYSKDNNNYASMISYCSNSLRHISDIQCSGSVCNGLKFTGCYTYYKPVIAMAQMILNDISIESNGNVNTTGYIVPYAISMEKLFEVYVRAYLKNNGISSYKSKDESGIRLEKFDDKTDVFMEEDGLLNPGKYISGSIKPDIILTNQDTGETVVLDVKYKDYTNGDSRNDRLQLLAYSMMMNADNVGIILPAQTEVEIFDARRINSMEHRVVKYHQMLLGMMKDNPEVADYIKKETFKDGKTP